MLNNTNNLLWSYKLFSHKTSIIIIIYNQRVKECNSLHYPLLLWWKHHHYQIDTPIRWFLLFFCLQHHNNKMHWIGAYPLVIYYDAPYGRIISIKKNVLAEYLPTYCKFMRYTFVRKSTALFFLFYIKSFILFLYKLLILLYICANHFL